MCRFIPIRFFIFCCSLLFSSFLFGQTATLDEINHEISNATTTQEKVHLMCHYAMALKENQQDVAITFAENALTESLNNSYLEGQIKAHYAIGLVYNQMGGAMHYRNMQAQFDKAITIYHELTIEHEATAQLKKDIADSYYWLGSIHRYWENYDSSEVYSNESLKLFTQLDDENGIAKANNTIGSIWFYKKEYEKAIKHFKIREAIQMKNGDSLEWAGALINIGAVYIENKELNKGREYTLKAIEISQKLNALSNINIALMNLSDLEMTLGNYKTAYQYDQQRFGVLIRRNAKRYNELAEENTIKYQTERKKKENEALSRKAEIDALKMEKQANEIIQTRLLLLGLSLFLIVGVAIFMVIIRHNKIKTIQQITEMRIQALNAQMNPHFLFNVLNSIQSFIVSNNGDQAERFLAKFAKLTRLMLDGSREEKITIEDEVTSLQLYLELEKLRFENKFNFSIEVDETIDTEFCLIPPLLIQPYVENSILHGMKGIEHEGNILVKMESKKDQIICTIKDNGIGRAKAKANKNKTNMEHKSVGLLIAKERLQQLNKSIALVELIKIEDLKDESNNPIGTKVEIVIPTF